MVTCRECKKLKPPEDFYMRSSGHTRMRVCKKCHSDRVNAKNRKTKETTP